MSSSVTPCPPETSRDHTALSRKQANPMTSPRKPTSVAPRLTSPTETTLADVLEKLAARRDFSAIRLRDLRSAVKRTATLLGEEPSRILLDLPTISAKLAAVNPNAAGLT